MGNWRCEGRRHSPLCKVVDETGVVQVDNVTRARALEIAEEHNTGVVPEPIPAGPVPFPESPVVEEDTSSFSGDGSFSSDRNPLMMTPEMVEEDDD